jgi:hypothetical protein
VAKGRDQWRVLFNTVMNFFFFGFHTRREIYRLAERLLASQEGLCSMELNTFFIVGTQF